MRPLLLSVWGSDVYEFPYRSFIHRRIVVKNLKRADKLAATSSAMAGQIVSLTGIPRDEIAVTPFGVDLEQFKFTDRSSRKDSKIVIGTVKGLKHVYGIDTLLRAFNELRKTTEVSPELMIYGDGSEEAKLKSLAEELKLDGSVRWMGRIPNKKVPEALEGMDIFACFSRQESFGVAAVEAMATGLPVAATDCPGFCEVIEDGSSGFIGPVEDHQKLSELLGRLVSNPALRADMGRKGRKIAEERYNWNENVTHMEKIFRDVMNRKKGEMS